MQQIALRDKYDGTNLLSRKAKLSESKPCVLIGCLSDNSVLGVVEL